MRLKAQGMLVPGGLSADFADEYRRIKRPLLANAYGKSSVLVDRGNLILVTSSVPNEGKTFSTVNLALSLAQEVDHMVLLIDGDLVKRSATRVFDLGGVPGFADVLNGDVSLSSAIWGCDIPNLFVLPAGSTHQNITEMFASRKMVELADTLAKRDQNRIVIIDSPPLLATPQTPVLINLIGQVAMVVAAGETPMSVVKDALELIPREKSIGLILNKVSDILRRQPNQYYGYYGYGD
ncbi:MAG: protein tyrosine kinase [Chromatiales bacterium]|nr:protein tyrosine kinase [Chromatiales bacterium]